MTRQFQIWMPKDFQHVSEWVNDEVRRRHQQSPAPNDAWSRAFDDLGDHLAEGEKKDAGVAVFCRAGGLDPKPVPLYEWRKERKERGQLTRDRISKSMFYMGNQETVCVAIRRSFRLGAGDRGEVISPAPNGARVSETEAHNFLKALDAEYEGKPAPSRKDVEELGRAKFSDKWSRRYTERRNALDSDSGAKIYPNLYSVKSGPRAKAR